MGEHKWLARGAKPGTNKDWRWKKRGENDRHWKHVRIMLTSKVCMKSFLSWVNHRLEPVGMAVTDFTTDLGDGLRLIALCEVLTGLKVRGYAKNPRFPAQKMSNITQALDFMTQHFGIRFVGCNAQGTFPSWPETKLTPYTFTFLFYSLSQACLSSLHTCIPFSNPIVSIIALILPFSHWRGL